jgi:hypothetical protein
MKQDITTSTETFMNHLNKVMKKPEGYSYELLTRGSKYFKVTMIPRGGGGSVYCFIDKLTGDIFKPAGWRAPAKGARGSVLIPESYTRSDWSGGWLYKIFGNVFNKNMIG